MAAMERAVAGAMGGVVATGAMTAVMTAAQRSGLMGKMPPRKIVESLLKRVTGRRPPPAASKPLSAAAHLAFGALAGAGYGLLVRQRRGLAGGLARGKAYGALVWLASYAGWVPALGIMPAPDRDWPGRQAAMLTAHLVYGSVLGALVGRKRSR